MREWPDSATIGQKVFCTETFGWYCGARGKLEIVAEVCRGDICEIVEIEPAETMRFFVFHHAPGFFFPSVYFQPFNEKRMQELRSLQGSGLWA